MPVHLAFVVVPRYVGKRRNQREWIRAINVDGSTNVFTRAAHGGVRRIVHLSSAVVYDLDMPYRGAIPESHPRRAFEGYAYAEDKITVEDWPTSLRKNTVG